MSWQKLMEPVPVSQDAPAAPAPGGRRGGRGPAATTSPVVDGYVLPAPANEVIAQGQHNDVPVLTGMNTGELGGIGASQPQVTLESFRNQARQRYGADADKFLALYPASNDQEAAAAQAHANRDQTLVSMYLWAKQRARTSKTKVFEYLWDHPLPGPDAPRFGAFHSSELAYVLNTLYASPRPFVDADRKIAETMSSYWANFAANGDPNGKGLAVWPAYGDQAQVMELGDKYEPIPLAGSAEKQAFFEGLLTRQ
jgi:para-nitrobenzyl esterase